MDCEEENQNNHYSKKNIQRAIEDSLESDPIKQAYYSEYENSFAPLKFHFVETFQFEQERDKNEIPTIVTDIMIIGDQHEAEIREVNSATPITMKLTTKQINEFCSMLRDLELLENKTEICGQADTSICFGDVEVSGFFWANPSEPHVNVLPFDYSFWIMHSGFSGRHSHSFRNLMKFLDEAFKDHENPPVLFKLLRYGAHR